MLSADRLRRLQVDRARYESELARRRFLRVDPDNRLINRLIARLWAVDDRKLKEISAGTFCYAGLFLVEGLGLLSRKRWAQYMTIVSTSALLPLEIYEIAHRFTRARIFTLLINIAIVIYLAARVRNESSA